jgi:hypothetical protein
VGNHIIHTNDTRHLIRLNDSLRVSSYAFEASTNPQTAKSTEHKDAPFVRAFGLPIMEWIVAPGNEKVSIRYANAMKARESTQPGEAVLLGNSDHSGFVMSVR